MIVNNLLNKISQVALWLFLLAIASLLSFHPISLVDWYTEKRLVQLVILIVMVITFVSSREIRKNFSELISITSNSWKLLFVVFFILGIISSSLSKLPLIAISELTNFFLLALLAVFVAVVRLKLGESFDKVFIGVFVVSVTAYMVSFFSTLTAALNSTGVIDEHELIAGVVNRRFLNQFQSISFPILLMAAFYFDRRKIQYYFIVFISSFWFMLMVLSDGRGVVLGTAVGIFLGGVFLKKHQKKWWKHSALVVFFGLIIYFLLEFILSYYTVIPSDILRETTGGRIKLWLHTIAQIMENPIFGVGPAHFAFQDNANSILSVAHPHNITIQLMYEWGVPAAFTVIALFVYALFSWVEQQSSEDINDPISLGLTTSLLAGVVHGHFSGVFVMPLSQLALVFVIGWMLAIYIENKEKLNTLITKNENSNNKVQPILIAGLSVISLVFLLYSISPQFKYLTAELQPEQTDLYLNGEYPAFTAPRYWIKTYIER